MKGFERNVGAVMWGDLVGWPTERSATVSIRAPQGGQAEATVFISWVR